MSASSGPARARLHIAREWDLYAFPAGVTPTDERGIALRVEELGQIIEAANAAICAELAAMKAELASVREEKQRLEDDIAENNRDRVLAELRGKNGNS